MSHFLLALACSGIGVLGAIVIGALGADVRGWLPHLARRLLHLACRRLPVNERWREEEWRAEVDLYADRPISMAIVALRVAVSVRSLAREANTFSAGVGDESHLSQSIELEPRLGAQTASVNVTLGDIWDALDSAGLRPDQGALGTAYFALPDGRLVGFPNHGFWDHGIASDELLAVVASWGVHPTHSGRYPRPTGTTAKSQERIKPRYVTR
jgi:hypothetical protein